MKKSLTLLLAALISSLALSARSLTPDEAFALIFNGPQKIKANNAFESFTLAKSLQSPISGLNTLYIFAPTEGKGFAVVAADDEIGDLLLGFSDEGRFDADNIPPAMQWWLDAWSMTVTHRLSQPYKPANKACAPRENIEPLVKTQWDQGNPYNSLTPMMQEVHAVTGCVATAMAQVMKTHNWPVTGVGSHAYQFTYSYDNQEYETTLSADFSNTTYDWDNMLDTYTGNETEAQINAVATLMSHCGIAVNMAYSPYASGASPIDAAKSLIDYFNYDKGIEYIDRAWYNESDWTNIIYRQLIAGCPVLYSGFDNSGSGHTFVCDGYSDGFFHINWGWGGICDGLYLLSELEPSIQGTGGGSGESGFKYSQSIISNIKRPNAESDYVKCMAISNLFYPEFDSYERNTQTHLNFLGFNYSLSLTPITLTYGIKLENKEAETYIPSPGFINDLPTCYGINNFHILSTDIPVGEYKVYPAFKCEDTWYDTHWDIEINAKPWLMTVTDSAISFTQDYEDPVEEFVAGDVNDDGVINALDAVIALDYMIGNEPANFHFNAADMDGNNKIEIKDIIRICEKILE